MVCRYVALPLIHRAPIRRAYYACYDATPYCRTRRYVIQYFHADIAVCHVLRCHRYSSAIIARASHVITSHTPKAFYAAQRHFHALLPPPLRHACYDEPAAAAAAVTMSPRRHAATPRLRRGCFAAAAVILRCCCRHVFAMRVATPRHGCALFFTLAYVVIVIYIAACCGGAYASDDIRRQARAHVCLRSSRYLSRFTLLLQQPLLFMPLPLSYC